MKDDDFSLRQVEVEEVDAEQFKRAGLFPGPTHTAEDDGSPFGKFRLPTLEEEARDAQVQEAVREWARNHNVFVFDRCPRCGKPPSRVTMGVGVLHFATQVVGCCHMHAQRREDARGTAFCMAELVVAWEVICALMG